MPNRDDLDAKIDLQLEKGYDAIERGDLAVAKKAAQEAVRLDGNVAEAHTLLGAVAEREGDVQAALAAYKTARKVDPAAFEPVIAMAEIEHAQGRADKARALFAEASERAEEEEEYVEALLARAEFELAEGEAENALAALTELPPVDLPEANDHLRAGDAYRQAGALSTGAEAQSAWAEAEGHFEKARRRAEQDRESVEVLADALYGLGLVAEARGDREKQAKHFTDVLALDCKEPSPPWALSDQKMEALVEDVLGELPERARELLANVPIVVEARPSRAQVEEGLDPRLLGLFQGPSHPENTGNPALQQIVLYTRNLERACADEEELAEEVRVTLLHETGHFFGLDEGALEEMGLD